MSKKKRSSAVVRRTASFRPQDTNENSHFLFFKMFSDDVLFRFTAHSTLHCARSLFLGSLQKCYRVDTTNKTIGRCWSLIWYTFSFFMSIRWRRGTASKANTQSALENFATHGFRKTVLTDLGLMWKQFNSRDGVDWVLIVMQPRQLLTSPWRGSKMTDDDENLIVVCSPCVGRNGVSGGVYIVHIHTGKSSIVSWC